MFCKLNQRKRHGNQKESWNRMKHKSSNPKNQQTAKTVFVLAAQNDVLDVSINQSEDTGQSDLEMVMLSSASIDDNC